MTEPQVSALHLLAISPLTVKGYRRASDRLERFVA